MEESWDNWPLQPEIDCEDEDEFLREILLQPSPQPQPPTPAPFSSESESDYSFHAVSATNGVVLSPIGNNLVKSNSSNSIVSTQTGSKRHRRSSSPKTYILSFDNSTMIPATPEPCVNYGTESKRFSHSSSSSLPSNKRHMESQNGAEVEKRGNNNINGAKKGRSSSQTMDHIMAERKRRQELTERFIALSATIPGLSKTDKASVLRAAIDYVKQLRERVEELEKQDKKGGNNVAASVIVIKKPDLRGINNNHNNHEDSNITTTTTTTTTTSSETSSDNHCGSTLPEIEARALGKEVLIEIHCEKEKGIELKLLTHLENLQLCVTGSSVLPFGNSALSITIIAQMGEGYKMTVSDLVKSLRQVLLKSHVACDSDPY